MVKKLLTLALGLTLCIGASAQSKSVSINASGVQYWTGTGSNSTLVCIGWDDSGNSAGYTPTVVVWGVRWAGSITLLDALDTIAAYDSRFSYSITGSIVAGLYYNDAANGINLTPSAGWNCNNYNGTYGITDLGSTWLRISESTCSDYDFTQVNNLIYASGPSAPSLPDTVDASIAFGDILYWVGSGADSAVLIVSYAQLDTALAWGYLFSGTTTAQAMVNAIAAADPRFWVEGEPSFNGDLHFLTDQGDTLGLSPVDPAVGYNFWWTNLNGVSTANGSGATLHNGDVFKYGDMNSATGWNYQYGFYMEEAWSTTPTPVPAPEAAPGDTTEVPEEATFAASAVECWVGEGANQVVMAVNWADTALAWGYRFDGSKTVGDMMADIAAADARFSYTIAGGYLSDILFATPAGDTLRGTSWWESRNNGVSDMGMSQTLADGDFEKWADPTAGVVVDSVYYDGWGWSYLYVYPMAIHAASQPLGAGPFCGIVGSEGCTAIAADSPAILAWATACTVVRGSQNLSDPEAPAVTYGADDDAVGAATANTMDVVSLGDGGTATLTFARPIKNGEGPDFAVFENSFDDYFLELAFVEVSSDGERFVRFPATSLTQTARQLAGSVDATYINNLAGKYRVGYGTPFDLAELADSTGLDINSVTHVRIVDVVGSIDPRYATYDAFGHMVNDPFPTVTYSAGFDLDGVAVLHQEGEGIDDVQAAEVRVYPNPVADRLTLCGAAGSEATLYDMTGRLVGTWQVGADRWQLGTADLKSGVYMLRVGGSTLRIVKQ